MKHLFILTFFLFSNYFLNAQQAPAIQWQKSLGGTNDDRPFCTRKTSDAGYVVAGASFSNDGDVSGHHGTLNFADFWITKLSSTGSLDWQKSLGGTGDDWARSIQQTLDGGYIIAGYTTSSNGDVTGHHGDYDCWVVKLSADGSLAWQKTLGGTFEDRAYCIQQTSDSGYIIAAESLSDDGDVTGHRGSTYNSDYWVVKLSGTGNIEWEKSLGGTWNDHAYSIQQTSDQGYIVCGISNSADGDVSGNHSIGNYDYWVVKLDSQGGIAWQKCLGGTQFENGQGIRQTTDGGYIVGGFSYSADGDVTGHHGSTGNADFWTVKLGSTGGIQWQKSLGGTGGDWAFAIEPTADGGYITVGVSNSTNGDASGNNDIYGNYWIVKISNTGMLQWQKSLGSPTLYGEEAYSIQQTSDNGYIIAGSASANGGDVTGNHGNADFWIVKLAPDVSNPVYTFTGNGNWDIPANWSSNVVPPAIVPAGAQIIIKPQPGGECILNVPVTISNGASLWIVPGAAFNASSNLSILHP
jgi:hypothetical protein